MRRLRHLVNPSLGNKAVVEITGRTAGAQFLLKPDNQVNAIIAGVLARAKANTDVAIHAHAFLSNHALCAAVHKTCYAPFRIMRS